MSLRRLSYRLSFFICLLESSLVKQTKQLIKKNHKQYYRSYIGLVLKLRLQHDNKYGGEPTLLYKECYYPSL